jgi:ATP-dependent RNA helicase DDX24/MAK5
VSAYKAEAVTDQVRLSDVEDEFEGGTHRKMQPKKKQDAVGAAKVPALKAELKALLAEPLIARGVSARYPTSGSKVIIDDLINATGKQRHLYIVSLRQLTCYLAGHTNMLGAKTNTAYDEVLAVKKAKLQIGNQRKRKAAQAAKK